MNNKALSAVWIVSKFLLASSAGYFVYKLTEEKANDMVQEGGVLSAIAIGTGQVVLASVTSTLAYLAI